MKKPSTNPFADVLNRTLNTRVDRPYVHETLEEFLNDTTPEEDEYYEKLFNGEIQ